MPKLSPALRDDMIGVPYDGTPRPPQVLQFLVHRLGVLDADVATQDQAIRAWLASNQPTPNLAASFRRLGRGYLLDEAGIS
ncbi:MAG: hypothetical protein KDC23_09285 [Actinobacteria bacterium]|nr:hypothetical protein [Actinomycetota bacterium]